MPLTACCSRCRPVRAYAPRPPAMTEPNHPAAAAAAETAALPHAKGPSPEAPVRVLVELMSGQGLEMDARPSDTVASLEEAVEQQLGLDFLHEARLVVGEERPNRDLPVGWLAERQGKQAVSVQAVLAQSTRKAIEAVESEEFVRNFFDRGWDLSDASGRQKMAPLVAKYTPVFEIMIDAKWTGPWLTLLQCSSSGYPEAPVFSRFAAMFNRLAWGRPLERLFFPVLFGEVYSVTLGLGPATPTLQSTHEELNECVIAAIEDPNCHENFEHGWSLFLFDSWPQGWQPTVPEDAPESQEAFDFLAQLHPQAAVRDAARRQLPVAAPLLTDAAPARAAERGQHAPGAEAATDPAEPSDEREVEEIAEALRLSDADALARESEEVSGAVLRSKADRWSADGVVLARLNFHTPEVLEMLRCSELLAPCRARVAGAGCEPSPPWAGGALLLVPATEEQIADAGIQLKAHHILMLSADRDLVERALGELPCRKRPKVKPERYPEGSTCCAGPARAQGLNSDEVAPLALPPAQAKEGEPTGHKSVGDGRASAAAAAAPCHGASEQVGVCSGPRAPVWQSIGGIEIQVENTFVHFPVPKDISEASSAVAESAPARLCASASRAGESQQQSNPRRWQPAAARR